MSHAATRKTYPMLPKFWQPKVAPSVTTVVQIYHWDYIDKFARGTADATLMWEWIEAGLTYSEMMRLLMADGIEFTEAAKSAIVNQLGIQPNVRARFIQTGRVGFSGSELAIARVAASVMDQLIAMDRHGIAWAARQWSNAQLRKLKDNAVQTTGATP